MRFLRVFRLGLVPPRRLRHIARAIVGFDHAADGGDRFAGNLHAVGTHISDQADGLAADVDAFIETLRHPHRVRRREAQLAAGFLLQRRGGEGRLRMPLDRLCFHAGDGESRGFERLLEGLRLGAGADIEPLQLLAVGADQARLERLVARRRQRRDQLPIFLADELFDFQLAVGRPAAAPPIAPGRPSARRAACATAPATA